MRRWRRAAALLAVALPGAALAQAAQEDAAPRPPEVGTVSGSVSDPTGAGVPRAVVTLSAGQQVTTDATGQFLFAGVPAGGYAIGVDAAGYESMQMSIRVQGSGDSRVDVVLQRGG